MPSRRRFLISLLGSAVGAAHWWWRIVDEPSRSPDGGISQVEFVGPRDATTSFSLSLDAGMTAYVLLELDQPMQCSYQVWATNEQPITVRFAKFSGTAIDAERDDVQFVPRLTRTREKNVGGSVELPASTGLFGLVLEHPPDGAWLPADRDTDPAEITYQFAFTPLTE